MSLPARQREALLAMPLISDKATASLLNVSPSHLCGTLTALLGRGYIVSEPTRSPYGRIVRRWILTSKGEIAVARLKRKVNREEVGMTQEEKRIKIAEACGITAYVHDLPDYFNDLNACREMEESGHKSQPSGWLARYDEALTELCSKRQYPHWKPICALPEDRAEAFGITLNLWEAGE